MKRSLPFLLLFIVPMFLFSQDKKTKTRSIFYDWGTASFGFQGGTAHVDNLYGMWNGSTTTSKGVDAKFGTPNIYFKVENITRYIYWNMELAWPFEKKVTIENETNTQFEKFSGRARFGRLINIPIALGGFISKRWGLWGGYNYSLFYLKANQSGFTGGAAPYGNVESFRAGDVGILKGSGLCLHTMIQSGKHNLFRFSLFGNQANNPSGKAKGGSLVTELVYFINMDKNDPSSGMIIRLQKSKLNCTDHAFIGRFNNEPTALKATALSIELCFGIPETKHRHSQVEQKK